MNSHIWIVTFMVGCIVISGCRREDPNPELSDKIYLDIKNEVQAGERGVEELQKKVAGAEQNLQASLPRSLDRRTAQDELVKFRAALAKTTEQLEYFRVRLSRRYAETRYNYKVAFRSGRPWPPPNEFENYMINKKLANAPKAWSAHLVSESEARENKAADAESTNQEK